MTNTDESYFPELFEALERDLMRDEDSPSPNDSQAHLSRIYSKFENVLENSEIIELTTLPSFPAHLPSSPEFEYMLDEPGEVPTMHAIFTESPSAYFSNPVYFEPPNQFENPNAQHEPFPAVHYRGVTKRSSGRFGAKIKHLGKDHWLGTYDTAIEAAMAYDQAAFNIRGRRAILNFPIEAGNLESNASWSRE
jgi:hypothetical protein